MLLFKFKVKLPTLGWIPATAFGVTKAKAEKEIWARFDAAEEVSFVGEVELYSKRIANVCAVSKAPLPD